MAEATTTLTTSAFAFFALDVLPPEQRQNDVLAAKLLKNVRVIRWDAL